MSDDDVIKFEITDHDLNEEFNPFRGRKPNREKQIYGVWAADSDEDENEDNMRARRRKPKDFSAPIGFVAGGVQQAGKKKEISNGDTTPSMKPRYTEDSSDEEQIETPHESETAGIRRTGQGMKTSTIGSGLGNWEKHTKGIGAKLLLQMGYKPGKGLGKDLQGISAPIEATVRKGRGAIGAYGPEKSTIKAKKEQEKRALLEEKDEDAQKKSYNWKKSHKGRYYYRDASDVIQEGKPSTHTIGTSELSRVPVIDMTGKERRVLSGYHALASSAPRFEHEPRRECTNFAMPELQHNLQLAVECCEQDIINNARRLQSTEDEIVALERDVKECEKNMWEQSKLVNNIQSILSSIELLKKCNDCSKVFQTIDNLKSTHPLEYDIFELGKLLLEVLSPIFEGSLKDWDPILDPDKPVPLFTRAQLLLTPESYNALLWTHLVPHLKKAASVWNPRSPEKMLRTIQTWLNVLDAWIGKEIVQQVIVSRITVAVSTWDPTNDTQPLHQWILPWHHIAGEALATSVYPEIRSRLASALSSWHPSDPSARVLLTSWQPAWGASLTAFLHTHILPTLEQALSQSPVHLVGGNNVAWQWCVEWLELLGAATLGQLAARSLLPRWLTALAAWLNTTPDHTTVLHSYTDFKKSFPDEILQEPGVIEAFRKALNMLNRSADLEVVAPSPPRIDNIEMSDNIKTLANALSSVSSFTDLLESRCAEKNISFVPMPGRYREGRPLFKLDGKIQCYILRNVIMCSVDSGKTFAPVSLENLLKYVSD